MLRHKRVINFSLKSLKSSDVRSFHLTCSSFLRKVASSRKRYPEINSAAGEGAVAGNFTAQPLKSTFNNFYGIESDEGVILVTDKPNTVKSSHDSFINTLVSKKLPEKFKKTSFGKVRLDTENKVILHGQFEESTSLSDLEETIRATRLRNFAIEDSDTNSLSMEEAQVNSNESQNINLSHLDDIKYQTEGVVKRSEINIDETQNDISLIDELYFPDKMLQNQESDGIAHTNPSINEKGDSYIDECYFSNIPTEKNIEQAKIFTNEKVGNEKYTNDSLHKKSALSEENLGYIDQSFFDTTQINMNNEENLNFVSEKELASEIIQNNSQTEHFSSTNKEESMSFIDECFFNEGLESKIVGKSTKHSIENVSFPEIPLCPDNIKEENINLKKFNEKKPVYKSNAEINNKNMECNEDKNQKYNSNTKTLNTMEEETLYYNSSEQNQHDETFTKGVSSNKNTNFTYKEVLRESLNSAINPKTIPRIDLTKTYPNAERLNQTNKVSGKVNSSNEKEKKQTEDQPETAFDFVKKFRGDQKATYHESISGFSSTPREKRDSKGLKILKYQVPELKYFTRDEMLELLAKNVLYSDDDVVVLNKPYNLVMHESKTTKDACLSNYLDDFAGVLDRNTKKPKLLTVHRLDKETTGCLLLARNEVSAQKLKSLFAQRKIVKTYWIVTIRVPDPLEGIIDIPIAEGSIDNRARMVLHPHLPKDIAYKNHSKRGKNAVTHYNVISESGSAALVEVKPETGIKHQIRVHFGLGLACPILGDHKYSYPDKFVPQKLSNDMLHRLQVQQSKVRHIPMHIYARSIFIPQYTTGRNLFVMAPMPIHMSKNLQALKFKKK